MTDATLINATRDTGCSTSFTRNERGSEAGKAVNSARSFW
jgi:hypothetical protein